MPSPQRILLVRLSHLGDVVHALPVFHALRKRHPDSEIGWAVQPEFAGLLREMPGLDKIFEFDRKGGLWAWKRLIPQLRSWGPDLTVDCQGNLKSAAVTRLSGASRRVGFHRADWREPIGALALTEMAAPARAGKQHALDRTEALVTHLAPSAHWSTTPSLSNKELEQARKCWQEFALRRAPVLLHLSAEEDVRAWPVSAFCELARELLAKGHDVLLLSGPTEEAEGRMAQRELADLPTIRHWVGQRGLRELAGFLTVAAEHCCRMVACDTGPMHLAVACGVNVLGLAGPQDPAQTGPYSLIEGDSTKQDSLTSHKQPACSPCLARRCTHMQGPVCMSSIQVEEVLARLHSQGTRELTPKAAHSRPS